MPNAYDSPEELGLTIIAVIEHTDEAYNFDTRVVWSNGKELFTARDSGCSCPTPFEDYTAIENLDKLDWDVLFNEVMAEDYPTLAAKQEFLEKVRLAMLHPKIGGKGGGFTIE